MPDLIVPGQFVPARCPSKRWAAGTTDKITHTNPLTYGAGTEFTFLMWAKHLAVPSVDSRGFSKGTTNDLLVFTATGTDRWSFNVGRATVLGEVQVVATNLLVVGGVEFVALTYNETNGPQIFRGFPGRLALQCSYSSQAVGSGNTSANTGDFWINNRGAANTLALAMDIYCYALLSRRLTPPEIQAHQFDWSPRPDHVLLVKVDGTSLTQRDRSKKSNHGTVTGTASIPTFL